MPAKIYIFLNYFRSDSNAKVKDMKKKQSVTLCGETLTGPLHICAFFDSREEQYEVLFPWIKEGIANNEEVLTILESDLHTDYYTRLSTQIFRLMKR